MTISIADTVPNPTARLGDWERSLGRFIINFGMIEYLVEVFLKDHLERTEFEKVRQRHLNDRVARIVTYLEETGSSKEVQDEFALLVERLDPVRKFRNHIVHGHLQCRIIPDTETLVVTIARSMDLDAEYSQDAQHVEFDKLCSRLQELTEFIEAFKGFVGFKS